MKMTLSPCRGISLLKNRFLFLCFSFTLLSILLTGTLFGQTNKEYRLKGIVLNARDQQPIPSAVLIVKTTGKGTAASVDGYFSLELPSDTSTVVVSSMGYKTKIVKLTPYVALNYYNIKLEEDIKSLDEVTVVAEKERIVRISENISSVKMSPKLVARLPNMGEVDVMRSFQLLPGVSATNETSAGLYVRGGTPDQNLILFDGMTIYHVDHFYGFFSAFNANTIDDIELMKGGFPARYGGRVSSVMEITGKPADLKRANGTATVSLLSVNAAVEVPIVKNKLSLQMAARRSYTDIIRTGLYKKIFDLYSESSQQQQPTGGRGMRGFASQEQQPSFYFYDLNSKLTYQINKQHSVAISLYSGKDNLDNSREASSFGGFGGQSFSTPASTDIASWGNNGVSGVWKADWTPKFNSSLFVSYSKYFSNRDQRSDTTSRFNMQMNMLEDNYVEDYSLRFRNEWKVDDNNTAEFGFESTVNNITYSLVFNDTATMVNKKNRGSQSAIYLQDKINFLSNKMSLNVGLRTTYQDVTERLYFEPRVAFTYRYNKNIRFNSAWGKYNQLTTRVIREDVLQGSKDFWLLADGETIPVSSAYHYILGTSYEKGDYLVNVEAYYKDLSGLTEYTLRTTRSFRQAMAQQEYFFEGTGYAKGIEVLLQKKYGLNTGWISYTLSEVKHKFADLNYGKPYYAPHDQPHEYKGVYSRKIKDWDFSLTYVYATGKPHTAPESQYQITMLDGTKYDYVHVSEKNSIRLPDYHKLDFAVSYNWHGIMADKTLSLSIFNVYNRKNIWYKKYDIAEDQITVTNVNYLGFTPNVSFTIKFK